MGGGGKTTTKQQSTTQNKIAPWMEKASKGAVAIGERIANRQYEGFTGRRVAGLSGLEQQANQGVAGIMGQVDQAMIRRASGSLADADYGRLMNPYTENVLNRQRTRAMKDFGREQAELSRRGDMIRAFGGDRFTLMQERLNERRDDTLADIDAQGYKNAFENAQAIAAQDRSSAQGFITGAIQAAREAGKDERQIQQMEKDFDYLQFLEKRDWDVNNLGPLLQSIQTAKYSTTQETDSTTTEKKSGSKLGSIVGGLAAVGAMFVPGGALAATALGKSAFGAALGNVGKVAGSFSGAFGGDD